MIKKLFGRSSLTALQITAEETTEVVLVSFFALQEKYGYTLHTKQDKLNVYTKILELREYKDSEIVSALKITQDFSEGLNEPKGPSLICFISAVIRYEHEIDNGIRLDAKKIGEIHSTVIKSFKKRGLA